MNNTILLLCVSKKSDTIPIPPESDTIVVALVDLFCCVLLPVICEGLHDLHHQAAAGFRLHAWLGFPLRSKRLNTKQLESFRFGLLEADYDVVCFPR